MRFIFLTILPILIFSPTYIHADPSDKDTTLVEYSENGLRLLYFFTNEQFFEEWSKPEPPHVSSVKSANRGDRIFPVILYGTDAADVNGNAFLTYDITILRPDGSVYGTFSDLTICRDEPADNIHLHLLEQPASITIEEEDPSGDYTVNVVIHEKNKEVSVPLSLSFHVEETTTVNSSLDTLTKIRSQKDLSLFTEEYYISPRPDLVTAALILISDSGLLEDENAIPPMYGFFSQVFFQVSNDEKLWKSLTKQYPSLADLVNSAVRASGNPKEAFRKEPISPSLNDIYWGAFFASGDIYFIEEITKHLKYLDERNDLLLYLAGSSAEWSLSSNAAMRPKVKSDLLLIKEKANPHIARRIESLLAKRPDEIRQEMQDVIMEQVAKGVWN